MADDDDAVTGYIDAARQGARLTTFQGRVTNWRVTEVGRTYRNAEGDRSYAVLLADGRGRFAGGLLLGDGGTLFRGTMLEGKRHAGMIRDAEHEADYWAQKDAEDDAARDDDDDFEDDDAGDFEDDGAEDFDVDYDDDDDD